MAEMRNAGAKPRPPLMSFPMTLEGRQFCVRSQCELLPYLTSLPLGLSRKQAKDLLRFHAVQVQNQATVRHDTRLLAGDVVTIALRKQPRDPALMGHGLRIIYLDDTIVVVDKPAGLLSMGSAREKDKTAHRILNEHLRKLTNSRLQQIFIVHRLDRETSGLMIFARSEIAQAVLQQNWKQVTKSYLAVVEGVPGPSRGTLKYNLAETSSLRVRRVAQGGELAITHYHVIGLYGDKALLQLTLETGRKHQIRVQLAFFGHPVIGDRKYGKRTDSTQRLALHSCELRFRHPVSCTPMEFHSPLPARLKELIEPRGAAC
jgi:23S rRNA pseudouridine1911/1915/1917 synthase